GAVLRLVLDLAPCFLEQRRRAIRDQLAVAAMVEFKRRFGKPRMQGVTAEIRQLQQGRGRGLGGRGVAGLEEGGEPAPLPKVDLRSEAQGRRWVEQPLGQIVKYARVGQWGDVVVAELAAVGIAGQQPGPGPCLKQYNLLALAQ